MLLSIADSRDENMLSRIIYDLYMRILELNNSGVNYPRKYNTHLEIIARNKSYPHMSDFSNSFLDHLARTDVCLCHFATTRNKWSHYDFTTGDPFLCLCLFIPFAYKIQCFHKYNFYIFYFSKLLLRVNCYRREIGTHRRCLQNS